MGKNWRRLNGQRLDGNIYQVVEKAIQREQSEGHRLKVCIGTDSMVRGSQTDFATVIVFLREKKGGFMFINKESAKKETTLKERMVLEVSKSVDIAYKLCKLFDKYNVELEVHADINTDPNFKSNIALKEAMGYIMGMGFQFKAKPDAFASSSCADKVV